MTEAEGPTRRERLEHIDLAIARDIERRRRSRRIYWLLLVAAVGVTIAAVLMSRRELENVARELTRSEAFPQAVANAVESSPAVEENLRETVERKTIDVASSPRFAEELLSSPSFRGPLTELGREAVASSIREPEVRTLIEEAVASSAAQAEVASRLASAEDRLSEQQSRTATMAREQQDLARRLDDAAAATVTIDSLEKKVADLTATLEAQQAELDRLVTQSKGTPTSFLLKEKEVTSLPGLGLSVALGRRVSDGVEDVRISSGTGPVYPAVVSGTGPGQSTKVSFGESFEFDDGLGTRFRATLPNAQSRFLAKDFVVLDVVRLPPSP